MTHDEGPFDGNAEQRRMIEDSVAKSMLYRIRDTRPHQEMPPFVKWFSVAVGALGSAALVGLGIWLVTSVSTMSNTLARMDERQIASAASLADRFERIDERLARLEGQKENVR